MNVEDFEIGKVFIASAGFRWLCTDKGTRTITAIMLLPDKEPYWFAGPPYSVEEVVFDSYAMKNCYYKDRNVIVDRIERSDRSVHPGFMLEDVSKMMKSKNNKYPREALLKRDRVSKDGFILHPYAAVKKEDNWYIKAFEIFSKEYLEIHEDEFVQLVFSSEAAMVKRKQDLTKA